jgi:Beta/Gamma crystallin
MVFKPPVILYSDRNYEGTNLEVGHHTVESVALYDVDKLIPANDRVSSIRIQQGYQVRLYEHSKFSGRCKILYEDTPYIGDDFNDKISSIEIYQMPAFGVDYTVQKHDTLSFIAVKFYGEATEEGINRIRRAYEFGLSSTSDRLTPSFDGNTLQPGITFMVPYPKRLP